MYIDAKEFGYRFKSVREQRGVTIQQLENLSGISKSTILALEKGTRLARIDTLEILSFYLQINMLEVLLTSSKLQVTEFHDILFNFRNCLIRHDYLSTGTFIKRLQNIYSKYEYNSSLIQDVEFFNSLEMAILWIQGVDLSINGREDEAEEILCSAIRINHSDFCISRIDDFNYSALELYVINSILANRTRHEKTAECKLCLRTLIDKVKSMEIKEIELLMILYNNLANYLLEDGDYASVKLLMEEAMLTAEKFCVKEYYTTYKLFLFVAMYLEGDNQEIDELQKIVYSIEVEGKKEVAIKVRKNLKLKYGIELE